MDRSHLKRAFGRRWWVGLLTGALALGALGMPATGQLEQRLADRLVQLSEVEIARAASVGALDQAQILLDLALEFAPDDPELWRRRATLARQSGQSETEIHAWRRYIEHRPEDDAAQLRYVLLRVQQAQTIEGQFDRLNRLLGGPQADQLSRRLRSRMASYGASLARELDDRQRLRDWLRLALELDELNPEALAMLYQTQRGRDASPAALGAIAVDLVRAAPASAQARLNLAQMLAEQAAYRQAAEQFQVAQRLARQPFGAGAYLTWTIALAGGGNDQGVVDLLRMLREVEHPLVAQGLPLDLRLMQMAVASDRSASLREQVFEGLDQQLTAFTQAGRLDEAEANLRRAWVAAVFDIHSGQVGDWLEQSPAEDPRRDRVRGWRALHAGDVDAARRYLEPIAEDDPLAAVGLARLSDEEQRAARLHAVLRDHAATLAGVLAHRELGRMGQARPTAAGRQLSQRMARAPGQIWQPAWQVQPWGTLRMVPQAGSVSAFEPIYLNLQLRNSARAPMPLGEETGLPGRVTVLVQPTRGGQRIAPPQPLTVDLGRRLVLEPGERVSLRARLDRSDFGRLLGQLPHASMNYDLTALSGAHYLPRRGLTRGPLGSRADETARRVSGQPITEENLQRWMEALEAGDQAEQMQAVARLAAAAADPPEDPPMTQMSERIGEAIGQAYGSLPRLLQAWTAASIPAGLHNEGLDRVRDNLQRSDDPLLRVLYLASQIHEADDTALAAGMRHDDPVISEFAHARRENLQALAERAAEREAQQEQAPPNEPQP